MTLEELKFKIDCAVDLYAIENAKFGKGYMFWDHAQHGYEINSIHGDISTIHDFKVRILYTCKRKTDGKIYIFSEDFVSGCEKIV